MCIRDRYMGEPSSHGSIQESLDYKRKIQRIQEYLEINKPFFFQYISQIRGEPLSVISAPQVLMPSQTISAPQVLMPSQTIAAPQVLMPSQSIAAPPLPQNFIPEGSVIPSPFPRVNPKQVY
eukprot:TRINITY_DN1168_c0_g1_i5.p1 TRINITY_DN1168_c0_g1~~TRINITY_DN1168_c0_g1_i5.p1  ORF type:complete len:122 (+),score=12.98 TRINITY_DN1168_c0_g1_i5:183-548(+)